MPCKFISESSQEEEAITNKLNKRLDILRKEKAEVIMSMMMPPSLMRITLISLSPKQMEAEEEAITSTLEKRLETASQQQEVIVSTLQKQLEQLKNEKAKLYSEKIALENHLEAEQEFIMNRLQKQVEKIRAEKMSLAKEKSDLRSHVLELTSSVERLKKDKVLLEMEMEMEEENITNRLQRQVRDTDSFRESK